MDVKKDKYNVMVIGSGGREHAILHYLKKSPFLDKLFVVPGRDAMKDLVDDIVDVGIDKDRDFMDIIVECKKKLVDLVVIGSEQYLIDGLSDKLLEEGIIVFGPSKSASRLESSKVFMKEICKSANVPTAKSTHFVDDKLAKEHVRRYFDSEKHQGVSGSGKLSLVVKADGPAFGKGVVICRSLQEAERAIDSMLVHKNFGPAGDSILIEEFLEGQEVSFFALVDGKNVVKLAVAKDYKTLNDNNKGPNTGGMGAYSSVGIISEDMEHRIMREIICPTVDHMCSLELPIRGVLFAGIMITKSGPKLLEYNVRFGDPETQCILPRIDMDLLNLLLLTARGKLGGQSVTLNGKAVVCVVVAAKGYPGEYRTGSFIKGIEQINRLPGVNVFHAGTKFVDGNWVSDGGRVLNIVAESNTNVADAKHNAYAALDILNWSDGVCRYDIGSDACGSKVI